MGRDWRLSWCVCPLPIDLAFAYLQCPWIQESYGRAKETHAHTQALWEKEIRRTRKETFKSQSVIVKLQEELKSARTALKSAQDTLLREKERSLNREQEAFQARYNLVGLQEQLDKNRSELEQALDRIKVAEQERDAFKTLAKTEEVARIAAEGMLPLPTSNSQDEDDEFASPRKATASRQTSLSLLDIKSSAASEAEIDELTRLWHWEKQRADRAADQVEYLEAECRLRACSCMRKRPCSSMSLLSPKRQKRGEPSPLADPSDRMILSEKATIPPPHATSAHSVPQPAKSKKMEHKAGRRETIFLPDLGTFQTVSAEEAEARNVVEVQEKMEENHMSTQARVEYVDRPMEDAPPHAQHQNEVERYVRTPSVEPPSYAVLGPDRQSLISLLDAPHRQGEPMIISRSVTPITPGVATDTTKVNVFKTRTDSFAQPQTRAPLRAQDPNVEMPEPAAAFKTSYDSRPHTTTSFYRTATQTSTVPLREENSDPSMAKKLMAFQRTPSRGRVVSDDGGPTWDVNNPALTPTMTREQALAKIRERRGRAKSGAVATPRKGMMKGVERRDLSAPAGRKGRIGS